jgi:hypothetical protein
MTLHVVHATQRFFKAQPTTVVVHAGWDRPLQQHFLRIYRLEKNGQINMMAPHFTSLVHGGPPSLQDIEGLLQRRRIGVTPLYRRGMWFGCNRFGV